MTDAARGTGDQDAFPLLQPAVLEQTLPGAQGRERDRRARNVVQGARLGSEEIRLDGGVLGRDAVAVERGEREAGLADRDALYIGSQGSHDARELVGRDRGEPVHGPGQLVSRDGGGVDVDECLAGARRGRLDVVQRQAVEAAGRMEP
jgi:hypothetical protein